MHFCLNHNAQVPKFTHRKNIFSYLTVNILFIPSQILPFNNKKLTAKKERNSINSHQRKPLKHKKFAMLNVSFCPFLEYTF